MYKNNASLVDFIINEHRPSVNNKTKIGIGLYTVGNIEYLVPNYLEKGQFPKISAKLPESIRPNSP